MMENAVPVLEQHLEEFMGPTAQTAVDSSRPMFYEIRMFDGTVDVQGDPFSTLDNSTEQPEIYGELIQKVASVLKAAENEYFENGMESELSRQLTGCISDYGRHVIVEIALHINHNLIDEEVVAEVLYCLGKIVDISSYDFRRTLLEQGLSHDSIIVRDGAYLGLSFLREPHSQHAVREAIQHEVNPDLRDNLQHLLDELEHAS